MPFDIRLRASQLLAEGKEIQSDEGHYSSMGLFVVDGSRTKKWLNDINLFASKLPTEYPLRKEIESTYFHRTRASTFQNMISYLESIVTDDSLSNSVASSPAEVNSLTGKEYDVFLSHANTDKSTYVEELYQTISKLGIRIFYDKQEISWGDNWKQRILDGTSKSEFAIIVISQNFFGREWTERELSEFLKQQNSSNQKIVLPLLLGVDRNNLIAHYPMLDEIQYISTVDYSVEEICILFAKELIKRIRE